MGPDGAVHILRKRASLHSEEEKDGGGGDLLPAVGSRARKGGLPTTAQKGEK